MFADSTGLLTRVRNFFISKKNDYVEELALRELILDIFLNDCSYSTNENSFNVIQHASFRLSSILHLFCKDGDHKHRLMLMLAAPVSNRWDHEDDGINIQPIQQIGIYSIYNIFC